MTALCDHPAVALSRMIAAREISPTELLEACLARIEAVNPALNAMVALDEAAARRAAKEAEAAIMAGATLGPLHGLPLGIKDLSETAGLRTTFGSELFADHVPEQDDELVADLRAAGAIIVGKTNTPEFGTGADTVNAVYGFTGNPFDPERSCGGSSGGSAVALASGMVPLATGSDQGGSLRTPAAYCGVIGFRGTPGLAGDPGKGFPWSPLTVQGPMARSVEDLALLLTAMAGRRRGDALSWAGNPFDFGDLPGCDLSRLRVAFSEDLGFAPMDDALRGVFRKRRDTMAGLFGRAEEAAPAFENNVERTFQVLRALGYLASHRRQLEVAANKVGPNVAANVRLGYEFSAVDAADALAGQGEMARRMAAFMAEFDLLITPAAAISPIREGVLYPEAVNGVPMPTYISWVGIAFGITLTGHPAIVLPCGLDDEGMPFGLQLVGRFGADAALLGIARAVESALADLPGCTRPLPDIAGLTRLAAS